MGATTNLTPAPNAHAHHAAIQAKLAANNQALIEIMVIETKNKLTGQVEPAGPKEQLKSLEKQLKDAKSTCQK